MGMPVVSKKVFVKFDAGNDQSIFYRAWRIMNLEGPLCPLPDPGQCALSAEIERMRRQQVHIDEIKRWCHVRTD